MNAYYIGIVLIICSGLLMLIGLFQSKNNFIDLSNVFVEHLKIFRNARRQYLTFYLYPLIMAIGISCIYIADVTMYQNIIVAVSIFVSMLLAMLSILTSKDYSRHSLDQQAKIKVVLKETNNAIVFCTFISILIIIVSLILIALSTLESKLVLRIMAILVYYLLQVLLINILLIVKRMSKLI